MRTLTYVPYLAAAGELKTKPTQHSVKELQSAGIQPDVLVLRTEHELSNTLRKKVALFCNVDENAVVQSIDAPTIYEVPILMQAQGLDETILKKMGLPVGDTPGLGPWRAFLERRHKAGNDRTGTHSTGGQVRFAGCLQIHPRSPFTSRNIQ